MFKNLISENQRKRQEQQRRRTTTSPAATFIPRLERHAVELKSNNRNPNKRTDEQQNLNKNQRRKNSTRLESKKKDQTQQNRHRNQQQSHQQIKEPEKCSLRLLERCSWPQCNHSCPTLTNPLTGEEMRFLELLSSFGLDIEAVATALGVDMQTLNNMDHTELVNLLTQQVS